MSEDLVRVLSDVRISDTIVEENRGRFFLGRKILPLDRDATTIDVLADALMDIGLARRGDDGSKGGDFYTLIEPGSGRKALVLTHEGLKMLSTQPDVMERFAVLAPRKALGYSGVYYPDWEIDSKDMARTRMPLLKMQHSPVLQEALRNKLITVPESQNGVAVFMPSQMGDIIDRNNTRNHYYAPKRINIEYNPDESIRGYSTELDQMSSHEQRMQNTANALGLKSQHGYDRNGFNTALMEHDDKGKKIGMTFPELSSMKAPDAAAETEFRTISDFLKSLVADFVRDPEPGPYMPVRPVVLEFTAQGYVPTADSDKFCSSVVTSGPGKPRAIQVAFENPEHAHALATMLCMNGVHVDNQMGLGRRK